MLAVVRVLATNIRLLCGKLFHRSRLKYGLFTCLACSDSVSLSNGAAIDFGQRLRTRGGCVFNVQKSGCLTFGRDIFLNKGCMFNCHSAISIGNGCEFGPNVLVYDHDHSFDGGLLKEGNYKCSDVYIGKNCWIGAGTIILRGTVLGDGCIIGAGSVVKGKYPADSLILQKRRTDVLPVLD